MAFPFKVLGNFARRDDGVFAVMFALMALPLIAMAGASVDYTIWMNARNTAQEAADAAALAGAASHAETHAEIEEIVGGITSTALTRYPGVALDDATYDPVTRRVTVTIGGAIDPYFLQLVGVQTLPVSAGAMAERATNGQLELALVLDNTYSMSDSDGSGSTKIQSLKNAANNLLTAIWSDGSENIQVGLVPYADYVNVGVSNRYQPWMSVAQDTSTTTTPPPRTCETRTTKSVCTKGEPKTCTRTVDGVVETYDCTPQTCENKEVPPYQYCTGGGNPSTTVTTWFGCVLSRIPRNLRLSDAEPATPYVGIMATSRKCMNAIIPLTQDQASVRNAINAMVTNIGTSYKPLTHIPSGLVWGINVLSHTQPFTQGQDYDPQNIEPRKAMILMTDGDNTLRFGASNGTHAAFSGTAAQIAAQKTATDSDTTALCTYAKSHKIEVFVVSFGVLLPASDTMLKNCATDAKHYYSAANAAELNRAFENIADQLRVVRIIQ